MMQALFSRRLLPLAAIVSSLGLSGVLSAAPAQAALVSTGACDNATLSQPFASLGDTNQYKLVPGGSFESGTAGWTLSGGAKVVAGSEPYGATGSVGKSSLYLPAGASAQTPYTCVNASYPSLRLFARNNSLLSTARGPACLLRPAAWARPDPRRGGCPQRSVEAEPADAHRLGSSRTAQRRHRPGGAPVHRAARRLADR